MASPPLAPDAGMVALAQRAAALEARGAWADAIGVWSSAVARDPSFLPAQLGLAQAQIRAGKPADALPILEHVTARAPGVPGAWLALGVAQSMLGRHDDAVANAKRAAALAPSVAALHVGLGDVLRQADLPEHATVAYRKALELAPGDADVLNKLATVERTMRNYDIAETLLRESCARAPGHPYARVNLGTLELQLGRPEDGKALLQSALGDARLPPDAKEEAADALAMLAERTALEGPIEAGLATDDPAPIAEALRKLERGRGLDDALIADLARIVDRHAGAASADERFAPGAPVSVAWPALEAHHSFRLPRTGEAIARSVELVARGEDGLTPDELDIIRYARVVAGQGHDRLDMDDPVAFEAWMRWRHAQITRHRPGVGPGQISIVNTILRTAIHVPRTPPVRTHATLVKVLRDLAPGMPAGAWRIAFVYMAILEIHPFADANGRTMRLLLNRLLIRIGLFPHLRRTGTDSEIQAIARATGDLEPLIDWLAANSRYAAGLDREWAEREPR
ncbi:MAG: tetratricopeptide repeat protein [Betaproteobacteria bacterium]|nr:tetratricopeptide repeat protein [Betaproteobacteria bacterium]